MKYYILFYNTNNDYIEKRKPFREEHLTLAKRAHSDGILLIAGALEDPRKEAVLIFKCEDRTAVEDFAKNDPYVINGVVKEWTISHWNVAVGGD